MKAAATAGVAILVAASACDGDSTPTTDSAAPKETEPSRFPSCRTRSVTTDARLAASSGLLAVKPPPPPPSAEEDDCTSGYSPCLPPASDYDCAGGSEDGPEYADGPIYVTGSDPYGLDSDSDGVACE